MSNPLYQSMVGGNTPIQMLNDLRSNPIQFLIKRGFNIPNNIPNDPNSITQYLLNSGQVSQARYNEAMRMAQNFRY